MSFENRKQQKEESVGGDFQLSRALTTLLFLAGEKKKKTHRRRIVGVEQGIYGVFFFFLFAELQHLQEIFLLLREIECRSQHRWRCLGSVDHRGWNRMDHAGT